VFIIFISNCFATVFSGSGTNTHTSSSVCVHLYKLVSPPLPELGFCFPLSSVFSSCLSSSSFSELFSCLSYFFFRSSSSFMILSASSSVTSCTSAYDSPLVLFACSSCSFFFFSSSFFYFKAASFFLSSWYIFRCSSSGLLTISLALSPYYRKSVFLLMKLKRLS